MLSLDQRQIERLCHDYPFFRTAIIRRATYPPHVEPIYTIGVDNLPVSRRGLDESVAVEVRGHGIFTHAAHGGGCTITPEGRAPGRDE